MASVEFRFRRENEAYWVDLDPVLGPGEPVISLDRDAYKIGDGTRRWSQLPYFRAAGGEDVDLSAHINSQSPHPVYDEGPSLVLLYTNAKV